MGWLYEIFEQYFSPKDHYMRSLGYPQDPRAEMNLGWEAPQRKTQADIYAPRGAIYHCQFNSSLDFCLRVVA